MTVITLLTQPDCGFCNHAKTILADIARDLPITVTEIDLGSPEGQQLGQGWVLFAPGLLIDGQPFGYGRISQRRLRQALINRPITTTKE
jgi:glutaredoxin